MFDVNVIRKDFPLLRGLKMQGKDLIYFDNSATTLKPRCVLDAVRDYDENYSCNTHRGDYDMAFKADQAYEGARKKVADFLNAEPREISFTSGTTMSLNAIAYGWSAFLTSEDEILITEAEHASNVLPWFRIQKEKGCKVSYIELDENGQVTPENLEKAITVHTKVVSVAHVSNVLGYKNDVKALACVAHKHGCIFIVDAAQSAPHIKLDVKDLDVDFLALSGHKMCGPTGIGVMYGKYDLLLKINPLNLGGGMNNTFNLCGDVSLLYPPARFEAGTQNIEGAIGLGAAVDYLEKIGMDNIETYEKELKRYAISRLKEIPNLILYNPDSDSGIITFNVKGTHAQDESSLLNSKGICVRSGQHCAKMLNDRLKTDSTVRASLYFYNTKEEIDVFVEALRKGGDFLDAFFD